MVDKTIHLLWIVEATTLIFLLMYILPFTFVGLVMGFKLMLGIIPYLVCQVALCAYLKEEGEEILDAMIHFYKHAVTILMINQLLDADGITTWNQVVVWWPSYSIVFWGIIHAAQLLYVLCCDKSVLDDLQVIGFKWLSL